jgi:FkbM family methyltransferase
MLRLTMGRTYGGPLTKLVPNPDQYREGAWRSVMRDGFHYRLDLAELGQWYAYWGFREEHSILFAEFCRGASVVIDVGANVGTSALIASQAVGTDGRVVAIEPDPLNYQRLREHLDLNGISNVTPLQIGLSDEAGEMRLEVPDAHNRGTARLTAGPGTVVRVTTLDALVADESLERVDAIKIDVEGWETHVIRGASHILRAFRPRLYVELADQHLRGAGSSAAELVGLIRSYGYDVRDIRTGASLTETGVAGWFADVLCHPVPTVPA